MKMNRFWLEIIVLGTAIAVALALFIATLGAAAVAVAGQTSNESVSAPTVYEGMVTCVHCGAKHAASLGRTASGCTLICVHGGSKFALVDGDKVYELDGDLGLLKKVAGQRARITGTTHGKTIQVSTVAPAI
jgi:hypothetical protein